MRMIIIVLWAHVFCTLPDVESARILAVQIFAGKSHFNFLSGVLRALTDGGHHVTVFTQFPEGDRDNYTEVDTSDRVAKKVGIDLMELIGTFGSITSTLRKSVPLCRESCDNIFSDDRMEHILKGEGSDFDVIFIIPMSSKCVTYPAAILNIPMIYLVPSPMLSYIERSMLGDISNPASVSHFMADHAIPKSFVQRFTNAALTVYGEMFLNYLEWVMELANPKPYDKVPSVTPSLVFINSHHSTEAPRLFPPNAIPIGGIHLKEAKSLPKDILQFIEDSPHGVIFCTFGSMVEMSTLPNHIQNAFKEAFAKVPQRVLLKYEGEMTDKPKNVMICKWFPQRDILMHPNVKLFISHGGISGLYEAVDGGIPVLGFPLFFDQPRNIENLVHIEMAISMNLLTVTTEKLLKNIFELINDEKYMRNAKIASERFKDRPMSPAQSVVYWTEYVIRHKGASHLKSYAYNLTWYEYLMLDVIFVTVIFIFIVVFIIFKCIHQCNYRNKFKFVHKMLKNRGT